jgi:glycosyltransferase involved in cell wall biosynthesis
MPVHNALPYLDEAIESILAQDFEDFEFVILDDASTDGSTERLRYWADRDPRIRLIRSERNLGPALSSDMVARAAHAPLQARMDADDVSYPFRLREQVEILRAHPDVGVVGGLWDVVDGKGRKVRNPEPWRIIRHSVFPPFGNGLMMYRRELFDQIGGYRSQSEFWEDLDLILRMAAATKVMVIPHAIYQLRQSETSTRIVSEERRLEAGVDLMYRASDCVARKQSYEALLTAAPQKVRKIDPRVFISLGLLSLWAGGHPRLFRRLLRRGDLKVNLASASALVWTAWATAHPSSLRQFLRFLLFARNRLAATLVKTEEPVLWKPGLGAFLKDGDGSRPLVSLPFSRLRLSREDPLNDYPRQQHGGEAPPKVRL